MNLYTWPLLAGDPGQTWTPGAGAADALRRYLAFYLATSLLWDTVAAAGNALLLAGLGRPTAVAGVPPDYFSATGQRWGNPLYDLSLIHI